MLKISGYKIHTQIYESGNSIVYRGYSEADGQPVILKIIQQEYPTLEQIARYKQEYELTSKL